MSHSQRRKLQPGNYRVVIDSELAPGSLSYGELVIPGQSDQEVLVSTYVCHPSMANNEVSGPSVACYLGKWLLGLPKHRYTYRLIFIPETIGSITYLSRNLEHLQKHVIAGFNISCVGDTRCYSYLPSRQGNTLSDRVALHVLKHLAGDFIRYSYLDRGSDERQYCSPRVDLPICCILRSKYGDYPEYHTSLDDLNLISPAGLEGSYECFRQCLICLEHNEVIQTNVLCEPQMGKRGLYPTLSGSSTSLTTRNLMNVLAYADGTKDLLGISDIIGQPMWALIELVQTLKENQLVRGLEEGGGHATGR